MGANALQLIGAKQDAVFGRVVVHGLVKNM
jgi:hypothetical protein